MTRIVNRVPTLRPPSRMCHDIRVMGGIDRWFNVIVTLYGDYTQAALAIAYGPGGNGIFNDHTWQIPDNPLDPSTWIDAWQENA